jgi:tellurite resistance protein TehA-like permease
VAVRAPPARTPPTPELRTTSIVFVLPSARLLDAVGPASGGIVMGTGIVSVALGLDGRQTLSDVVLAIAAAAWVALAVLAPIRARRDRARFRRDMAAPAAFTAVAGTAVLGTGLSAVGWAWAGSASLIAAVVGWLILLAPVLRHWSTPNGGDSFLPAVATQSLAVLAATLALADHARWLLVASLVPFALGLGCYVWVVGRFDARQLATGHGDHWVTGGALAISTLAAGRIALAAAGLDALPGAARLLRDAALGLWLLSLLWLPVLLVAEVRWPRAGYDVRRWATVFPVGMYAACSFEVGAVASAPAITWFARVWVWAALALWVVVACGLAGVAAATRASAR